MPFWYSVLIHAAVTAGVMLAVLAGFHRWVLRPYLDRKVASLLAAADEIEPRVTRGVKVGVAETLRELPESTVRDSTRQFLKFGSDLFENGLSSFLGTTDEFQRRARDDQPGSTTPGDRR